MNVALLKEKIITQLRQEWQARSRSERVRPYERFYCLKRRDGLSSGNCFLDYVYITREQVFGTSKGSLAASDGYFVATSVPPEWRNLPEHQRNRERNRHLLRIDWIHIIEMHLWGVRSKKSSMEFAGA